MLWRAASIWALSSIGVARWRPIGDAVSMPVSLRGHAGLSSCARGSAGERDPMAKPKGPRRFSIRSSRRVRALLLGLVALGSAVVAIGAYAANVLRTQDLSTVDTRFSVRGAEKPASNIVIV